VTSLIYISSPLYFLLAYGYNQPYPYGSGQGPVYGGLGMNSGFPYSGQGNYNGYYPNQAGNFGYPPGNNFVGPMRSGVVNPRTGGNIGGPSSIERRPAPLLGNPTNK
jgi:hypothetical protein